MGIKKDKPGFRISSILLKIANKMLEVLNFIYFGYARLAGTNRVFSTIS